MKKVLSHMKSEALEEFCLSINESAFRAKQIKNWVFNKSVNCIDDMTDLSKKFRDKLKPLCTITTTEIEQKQISFDGTVKYLCKFSDGNVCETVLMRFDNRENLTACVSSQIGCKMGCVFCQTGKRGFIRNLTPFEITDQVLTIQRDLNLKVTNVVFMGQGEPLDNLDNVLEAIKILNNEFNIGKRRITVSSCGLVLGINKLANMDFQSTLAISLHAPNNEIRQKIMPINKKYNINLLIESLENFVKLTNKRVTIEYTLIKDVNDSIDCAKELCMLIKNLKCNVNLIVYNPICDDKFQRPTPKTIQKFKYILEHSSKKVTIRLERGLDIDAACGQLSGKVKM